jgi:5-oxoprolinase (ATP-hydrolysing) subunit A
MATVDINCDLGEGAGHDMELMPLISSANIACGAHAGDEVTMRATVQLALKHGVMIGAHPGFPDRENFGRRELAVGAEEISRWVHAQTQGLIAIAGACGARVRHVKPHGALYNLAARDAGVARAVAEAVYEADSRLILVGLAGSRLLEAGADCGLSTMNEVFADRTYQADGSLTPRNRPDAVFEDEASVVEQVLRIVMEGKVTATDGSEVGIKADTLCLHGDGPHAVEFARAITAALRAAGVTIRA